MNRFIARLFVCGAVLMGLLTVVFFWKLGLRDVTPWVSLLASLQLASSSNERYKTFSRLTFQVVMVVIVSWTCFLLLNMWRGGETGGLFPLILIAFICMLLGMLMITLGMRLRR